MGAEDLDAFLEEMGGVGGIPIESKLLNYTEWEELTNGMKNTYGFASIGHSQIEKSSLGLVINRSLWTRWDVPLRLNFWTLHLDVNQIDKILI